MSVYTCYTCSNCGAVLNVEQGHKLFDCPFCGADFDYYYFYRKDLLAQAEGYLSKMDFAEAQKRFEDILSHEPQEFLALRGLVLCAGSIISIKNLTKPTKLKGCKFDKVRGVLTDVTDRAREEDKAYFHKLTELFELAEEYVNLRKERDELSSDTNAEFKKIVEIDNKSEKTKTVLGAILLFIGVLIVLPFAGEDTSTQQLIDAAVLALSIIGVAIVIGVFVAFGGAAFYITLGVVALILGIIFAARHFENKAKAPHRKKMKDNQGSIGTLSSKLTELEEKYISDYEELQKMVPDDRKRTKTAGKPIAYTATTEEEKQLVCNKCGGSLSLDRDRRLYECRSCGVAYSTVLMADTDSCKTATELLKKKQYKEADDRFVLEMLLDPGNFTALQGRILCAGQWDIVRHIKLEVFRDTKRLEQAKAMAEEAVAKAADEDKDYFLKFREVIEMLEQYSQLQIESANAPEKTVAEEDMDYGQLYDLRNKKYKDHPDDKQDVFNKGRFAQLMIELTKR